MNRLSLSKSALILSPCLGWAHPKAQWYKESVGDTTARDKGTNFHSFMEEHIGGSSPQPPEEDKEMVSWVYHGIHYVSVILGPNCDSLQSEVCVGVNWTTGEAEVLPLVEHRDYPVDKPGWMYGTADVVAVKKDGTLYVGDWKTGQGTGAKEQLMSLGWALQRAMPLPDGTLRRLELVCLSVREDGVYPETYTPDQAQLDAHADAMRFQTELAGNTKERVPGIHCTVLYCPHLAYCDAITDVVAGAAGEDRKKKGLPLLGPVVMTDSPVSEEEAGKVMEMVSAARRQMKYYEACMKEYIKNGGRVVSGDWEWRETGAGYRWVRRH